MFWYTWQSSAYLSGMWWLRTLIRGNSRTEAGIVWSSGLADFAAAVTVTALQGWQSRGWEKQHGNSRKEEHTMFHAVICSDLIEHRVIFSQLYQRVGIWGNSHQKHQTRGTITTYRSNIVTRQLPCTNKQKKKSLHTLELYFWYLFLYNSKLNLNPY